MFTAIQSTVKYFTPKVFKMLSVNIVDTVTEFQFLKKSPSIYCPNDITNQSRRMQGQFDSHYRFACVKLPQSNCYVNCEEKFPICFVTRELKFMRRQEISILLILTLRRTSPSKFMCLINRVSIQIIIIMIKNTQLFSLLSITTNGVHLMAVKF